MRVVPVSLPWYTERLDALWCAAHTYANDITCDRAAVAKEIRFNAFALLQADCAEASDADRAECERLIDTTAGWLARAGLDAASVKRNEVLRAYRLID